MTSDGHQQCRPPALTPLSGCSPMAYLDQLASSTTVAGGGAIGGGVVGPSLVRVEAVPLIVGKVLGLVPVKYFHLQASQGIDLSVDKKPE